MQFDHTTTPQLVAAEKTEAKLPAVLALIFGMFLVLSAGFANLPSVHNAAHDVRHTFSFPCH